MIMKKRGGAKAGDKTMVDALEPAVDELRRGLKAGLNLTEMLKQAALKAAEGAENTKSIDYPHAIDMLQCWESRLD